MSTLLKQCFLLLVFTLSSSFFAQAKTIPARAKSSASNTRPNIIFILVDDMGWGDLGVFYQNKRAKEKKPTQPSMMTPHLDTLAQGGMQLRQHYTAAPVCAPARASLLLGVHQGHSRAVRDNNFDFPLENVPTLGTVLKQAGYSTAIIGKWGVGGGKESGGDLATSPAYPTKRGFDYFFGYIDHISGHCHYPTTDKQLGPDGKNSVFDTLHSTEKEISAECAGAYSTDLFTARAKKWIIDEQKETPKKPFFLLLTYTAPHAQLQVPTQPYPQGGGLKGGIQWIGKKDNIINTANISRIDSYIYPEYASATYDHDKNPKTAEILWPQYAQRHATMIRRIDDSIADIEQLLKDLKITNNTLIVFTSDNGPHNEGGAGGKFIQKPEFFRSYGPFDGIKRDCWEGGIRVPTLVKWPHFIGKNTINETPSQFHDWLATFADAAGIAAPMNSDGVSLLPILTGKGTQRQNIVYGEYSIGGKTPPYPDFDLSHIIIRGQQQFVHVDNYKGVRYAIDSPTTPFRIYDVIKDPQEKTDLAANTGMEKIQQKMQDKVLQIRRAYDYSRGQKRDGKYRPYDKALVPSLIPEKQTTPGLLLQTAKGDFPWVPQFDSLNNKQEAIILNTKDGINIPASLEKTAQAINLKGHIDIPKDGEYTFYLHTDKNKGSKAYIRLHDIQLLDADNEYVSGEIRDSSAAIATVEGSSQTNSRPQIPLKSGKHPISITYITTGKGDPSLFLEWSTPDSPQKTKKTIPGELFSH